ncbi:dihydrodipicolinate synthase family protein [Bosea sp. PAMC 26642]|uniref:dihydrodipicolinate synthase family protein n=1 Tax=Bosea sp. (strain PAMC 26642) TaxID=1792307 RepID=UPI00077001D6|nr:dihydrodipicolinate synthase family protein [Bosea sp. PAMC 26642]AMJ63245.1 dihydrodipicolinate synthase family protein [Bosea sp. PAMC 26642]
MEGIIAYPVTPFDQAGIGVDKAALLAVTENLLRTCPAAIAFLGSAGESAYLSDDEWYSAAHWGISIVSGRVPVIIGIAELTTASAVAKARYAEAVGADMLMVIPVSYWKLSDAEIFEHISAIASATALPIMLYNNPVTSGVDMLPNLLVRLVQELPSVKSIKESSGDINRMHSIRKISGDAIPFYNGSNRLVFDALQAGASGWCTASPNLLDTKPAELFRLFRAGKLSEARSLFDAIFPVLEFLAARGLPATVKSGLALRGLNVGEPRRPLHPLSAGELMLLQRHLSTLAIAQIG